jgi:hypothetical protein
MYESFLTKNGKTKKIFNMTEITSPWAWKDSLERAYEKKVRKYTQVQIRFQQENPEYQEVRLNVVVVSPSGVFPMQSQKDFAIATILSRSKLAAHARCVVDAAISSAFEHYGAYCKALGFRDNVLGARSKYSPIELEFQDEAREMEIVGSIREVEVIDEAGPEATIAREETAMSAIELRKASELEQAVRIHTGLP